MERIRVLGHVLWFAQVLVSAFIALTSSLAFSAPPAVVNRQAPVIPTNYAQSLPLPSAQCQAVVDYLNSVSNGCNGAQMVTPCPIWSELLEDEPVATIESQNSGNLTTTRFNNFGSGCTETPLDWNMYGICTAPQWKYFGKSICRCELNQFEHDGTCVTSCPEGFKSEQRTCVKEPSSKNDGMGDGTNKPCLGNPCNPGTGTKTQREILYQSAAVNGPAIALMYNSRQPDDPLQQWSGGFGKGWISNLEQRITPTGDGIVTTRRADGKNWTFGAPGTGGMYTRDSDINDTLERMVDGSGVTTGWRVMAANGDLVELYDANGNLQSVTRRDGTSHTYTYSTATTNPTIAPWRELLIQVSDSFGRSLSFVYDTKSHIVSMSDAAGQSLLFEYDGPTGGCASPSTSNPACSAGNLTKITYQDGRQRLFHYNEAANINGGASCPSLPNGLLNHLTGITDENGTRFASYEYECSGRATATQHAGAVNRYSFTYNGDGTTTVVDPLGTNRLFSFQIVQGVVYDAGISQPCAHCGVNFASAQYDSNGNPSFRVDFNGNRIDYTFDLARNLETSRTEGLTSAGATTPETRTISTQWDANFRLPTAIAEPLRITTNVYDPDGTMCGARGALCSRTSQATTDGDGSQAFSAPPTGTPRTWTYTYNDNGSMLTMDGPRTDISDVTTYTYYSNDDADLGKRGNLASVTNPAGHVTSITAYNAHGQPLTIIDPNGLTTTLVYDPRQRLTSRTVGTETTSYEYDGVGQLTKITLPDGSFLTYSYDGAHRMTGMQDNLGNRIAYALDAMGNRTQEQVFDPGNNLAQTRSRVFNNLNRLFQEIGAASQVTQYAHDNQGNVTSVTDPLTKVTANAYDALNRLRQVTDPGLGVTQYAYNGLDALTAVTDPRSLTTSYTVDGLGNLTLQASPDTGNTANTYDAAGNLLSQTDAKSQSTSYVYDALNRVTLITFHDGSKQAYAYDLGTNGLGRLSSITETDAGNSVTNVIAYAYDPHGRVTGETRTLGGQAYVTAYSYDAFGRMNGMTYPSGRTVEYAFDALGRVSQVTTTKPGDSPQVVVQNVAYHPFGGVTGYTFGNGQVYSRGVDQDGRIASYTLGGSAFGIAFDAASRITGITEVGNPSNANAYGYDALDRLTSAVLPSSNFAYSYDPVGNRLTKTIGAGTDSYAYEATSNRIASVTPSSGPVKSFAFDAVGSTVADGANTYAYDTRGRMVQAVSSLGTTTYQVNALGQRVRKTNSSGDTIFHYDTRGRLIAETDPGGVLKRELIYLGDIPVGAVQ
jgi:YD repeat-containing protein